MNKIFATLKISLAAASLLLTSILNAQDTTPPVFDSYEPALALECSELDMLYVSASDESGGPVTITFTDQNFSGGCMPNILRTYYAEDESGNVSTAVQILNVQDLTPPIFIGIGPDMVMSCEETLPEIPEVTVYDECMEEEILDFSFTTQFIEGVCEQTIIWTWGATDFCGNYGEHTKTIVIVDETAPEFTVTPESMYVNCEDGFGEIPLVEAEDNCTEVTVTLEEEYIEGGLDNGEASYCTAQDVSWMNDYFSMKLIASPAQESYTTSDLVFMYMPDTGEGSSATLSGNVYGFDNPNAGWYIYMEFDNGLNWDDWSNQTFPTSYKDDLEIAGDAYLDWTYLLLNSTNSTMSGLGDYAGSELVLSHNPPNNYYAFQLGEYGSGFGPNQGFSGWFQATGTFLDSENSDPEIQEGIDFDYAGDIYTELICCPMETLIRTWTAEDECENVSTIQQYITMIDVLAPNFTYVPDDLVIECSDEIPFESAEAEDNCGEVTVTYEDEIITTECEGEYTINRTFMATDQCGLTTWATQIITVVDNTAPEFVNAPEDLVIDCEADIPPAKEVQALDACDSEVTVTMTEEIIGEMSPEGAESHCNATTPVNMEESWSLVFFDAVFGDVMAVTTEATFTQYPSDDGSTAAISAVLQSSTNENAGWNLEVNLINGMNWDDWSNQTFPTSYKNDLNVAEDLYEEWMYFIMENGTLTGWGDWEGTSLSLSHAPVNQYYGFQMGVNGANVNMEYGIGGWVHYSGTFYDEATKSIVLIDGAGDLAFDLDCCPMYMVERTWTTEDCSGNSNSVTQTISFESIEEPVQPFVETENERPFELVAAPVEDNYEISISPNPINPSSEIVIDSKVSAIGYVELYTSQGVLIERIWSGGLSSDYNQVIQFGRTDLAQGIYIVKLKTLNGEVNTKLIVD